MPKTTLMDYVPALRQGYGSPFEVTLVAGGTLAASSTAKLDTFVLPASFLPQRNGAKLMLAELSWSLGALGTTSGSTTFKIIKNGDTTNGILAAVTVAYNASLNYGTVDLRQTLNGLPLVVGDYISLLVTAIPGVASANLVAHLTGEAYAVQA